MKMALATRRADNSLFFPKRGTRVAFSNNNTQYGPSDDVFSLCRRVESRKLESGCKAIVVKGS